MLTKLEACELVGLRLELQMNEHIRTANNAMVRGDRDTAIREYYEVFSDLAAEKLDRRIATHRLMELLPDTVSASSASVLYHRPSCPASRAIWPNHRLTFADWREAESAGYRHCPTCNPPRPGSVRA
jgi:Metal binding domain of Ada